MLRFLAILALCLAVPCASPAQETIPVEVDWTRSEGQLNRAIFSIQGFMQVVDEEDPMVMDTFLLLNPQGTQTRLETWIHLMEPENDNDDPAVFDWDRLHPNKMIRFIEDRKPFEELLDELGMERLSLLCYNVDWLRSGDRDRPVRDNEEWAEFAAAVVETYNGVPGSPDYHPNLRLVQIWNEPNFEMFWEGTDEAFFDLYNAAAKRIRANYPGVLVGGPTITPAGGDIVEYMERFLAACGENTDYVIFHHYGPMGEGVAPITDNIKKFAEMFRAIPGKENGKVMITETDAWFVGWEKMDFVLERQFRMLELSDLIESIHHFCAMSYNESGNYSFGIVDEKGGIIGSTFWPYWLFRNTIGDLAAVTVPEDAKLDIVATHHRNEEGAFLGSTVLRNLSEARARSEVTLKFEPQEKVRILTMERVRDGYNGLQQVVTIPAGEASHTLLVNFFPREAVALTMRTPGKRHFHFRDLNNQEMPWVAATAIKNQINLGESVLLHTSVTNTIDRPLTGKLRLEGLPEGWTSVIPQATEDVTDLAVGQTARLAFSVQARNIPVDELVAVTVVFDEADGTTAVKDLAHSIPVSLQFNSPLDFQVLPLPVHAIPGEVNSVTLQITNKARGRVEGSINVELPEGLETEEEFPLAFSAAASHRERIVVPLSIPEGAAPGSRDGVIEVRFLENTARLPFTVEVGEDPGLGPQTVVDLTEHLNFDAVSFVTDRKDYDRESMGMFAFPGDYTPEGVLRTNGREFSLAPLTNGSKNAIQPDAQLITVPRSKVTGVNLLGFGHDGKHPGTWTLHYADGSSTAIDSMIPEWCTPPPPGYGVAFTAPFRYTPEGNAPPPCELFFWTLPADPERELMAVEFPEIKNGYVFAMTLMGQAP
jgi:hypothetical protein